VVSNKYMKRILLILFTAALAFSGWYLFSTWLLESPQPVINNQYTPLVPPDEALNAVRPAQTFSSKTGVFYSATPLINGPTTEILADNFYAVTDDLDLYEIYYNEPNGALMVNLYSEPLKKARLAAETKLQKILPYSPSELCEIDVKVIVSRNVSAGWADQNLGFSFCPNSINLP